ncbi:MAG TPA: MarP family serine protease [Streptosporangiaceae bacterium]|nr:MarP family serine protease [Streptosporangiaceae bacterium]
MPGDLLDLILIVLLIAFGVAGYRQGFIIGVLSFAGFIGGGAIGALFGPHIARAVTTNSAWQAIVAILVVFLAAMIGQLLASAVGVAMRSRLTWRPATFVDAIGGAVVSVISVLLIAWLIGSAVAYAPFPVISRQVNNSALLRTVDRLMPAEASVMFSDFRSLLESGPYAQVFGALGAEGALAVGPPNPTVVDAAGVGAAAPSIVKVEGVAPSCQERIEGSGFVYAPDHVLTNAHVVAGVTQGPEVITNQGTLNAHVVLYDPQRDLAVLYVPGLNAGPLRFAGQARSGASAVVAGYPLDGPFTTAAARVGGIEQATSPDIYQTAQVTRQIYSIRAVVKPGNSGGPLLTPGGAVYGVVFAAATSVPDTGYALTASEVQSDAAAGANSRTSVSTQGCD